MNRRGFVSTALAGMLLAPRAATAQQPAIRRIGLIASAPLTPVTDAFWDALVTGLRDHGWVESQNLAIERRYVELRMESALAATDELLRSRVELIVVGATQTAIAAKQVTRTIPIVMTIPSDPVAVGLVSSLSRPGGNVTG